MECCKMSSVKRYDDELECVNELVCADEEAEKWKPAADCNLRAPEVVEVCCMNMDFDASCGTCCIVEDSGRKLVDHPST
jgi:hypothetical protein